MVEPRREIKIAFYAGAFTGLAFLIAVYLDDKGVVDLLDGGLLLVFVPGAFVLFALIA